MGNIANAYKTLPTLRNRTPDTFTPFQISDDFTGIDDDPPNPIKWDTTNSPIILNNTLNIEVGTGASQNYRRVDSKYWVHGDFDVQADFNMLQHSGSNFWNIIFQAIGDGVQWYIQFTGGGYDYFISSHAGSGAVFQKIGVHSVGKFRLARVSGVVRFYFWNGGWQEHTNSPIAGSDSTEEVYFRLASQSWSAFPILETEFDNFLVNSADLITVR